MKKSKYPPEMRVYLETLKDFKEDLDLARIAGERGRFAPEGKYMLIAKHDEIRVLMKEIEQAIEGGNE